MRKVSSGSRPTVTLLLGLVAASFATRAASPTLAIGPHQNAPAGTSQLLVFGARDAAQRTANALPKFDASLAALVRQLPQVRTERALSDLHQLNPAARFRTGSASGEPMVLIDAVTRGDPQQLLNALSMLGLEGAAVFNNDVGGWLPLSRLEAAHERAELHSMRAAMMRARAGLVTSQGDFAQGSAALRSTHSLTGSGVTVGVLSDSFNCYAVYEQPNSGVSASGLNGFASNGILRNASDDESSEDLPASVDVIKEANCLRYGAPQQLPDTDEGRALLQIVHDVAPNAALAFYTADTSEADFATGIGKLAAAGAKVEVDDFGYFDEPFFQDGIIAQAIDQAEASGVAYFSAAGNDGTVSYDNTAPSFPVPSSNAWNAGEDLLNFDPSGATTTTTLMVNVPPLYPGEFVALVLEWDQPYVTGAPNSGGASSRLDLCVTGAATSPAIYDGTAAEPNCTGLNAIGKDPVRILVIGDPANASGSSSTETIGVQIGLSSGSAAPGRIKLALDADGAPLTITAAFQAASTPTLQGHPGAAGAMAVGVANFWDTPRCGVSPAILTSYSSRGGEPILFDVNGTRLATPEMRTKPDVVDADGVYTTFFGRTLAYYGRSDPSPVAECADPPSSQTPNFFGTSAAAPHAAGAAALLLQYNPAVTPTEIYDALRITADPMGASPNDDSGYGFVRADQALAQLPPAPAQQTGGASGTSGSHGGGGAVDVATLLALLALLRSAVRSPREAAK